MARTFPAGSASAAATADPAATPPREPALAGPPRRRVSTPLLVLLAIAVIEALAWTIAVPPLQGPDEIGHFAYTQRIVETRSIPWYPGGPPAQPGRAVSTEVWVAARYSDVFTESGNIVARPPGSAIAVRIWQREDDRLGDGARSDGSFTSPMSNPPLYYLYAAIPYVATYPLSFFDRSFAMRLANIPLLVVVVVLTWSIAGLLLPIGWPRALATAAVALNPQLSHLTAVINPDVLLAAEWTTFFYLALLSLIRGPTRGRVVGMALLAVASCLTHGRGIALLVPTALVFALLWWRRQPRTRGALIGVLAAGGVLFACAAYLAMRYATLGVMTGSSLRQAASYLWQFYLPKLPFMAPMIGPHWTVRQGLLDRFFSSYAQLEVTFSAGLLTWLARIAVALVVLGIVGLVVRLQACRDRRAALTIVGVLTAAIVAYVLDMHVAAYRSLVTGSADPVITGRYLLPLIPLYGAGLALALLWMPRRIAAAGGGALLAGLCLWQIGSLGILVERFYA